MTERYSDQPEDTPISPAGDRLAKVIARAGLCSRREAEDWIRAGRVAVNGQRVISPAFNVTDRDKIKVDGAPLAARQGTRVWLYHKPPGLVVTEKDPEGRPTVFEVLSEQGLPRVLSIGRLDLNTEGLLLLTNDGGLKRVLELPATGWLRRYRVRAFGSVTQAQLDGLKKGIEAEGVRYGPIEATLEREQGANTWLVLALREGKNREVKNVLAALGLQVNRLIRISYGPFQLGDLPVGAVEAVKARVLRDQLGRRLAEEANADFDSEMPDSPPVMTRDTSRSRNPAERLTRVGGESFKFADRPERAPMERHAGPGGPRPDRPGRGQPRRNAPQRAEAPAARPRRVLFDDGEIGEYVPKAPKGAPRGDAPVGKRFGDRPSFGDRPKRDVADRPKRDFGDRPKRDFGDRPPRADGPRPPRKFDDGPRRPSGDRPGFGDRPKRSFGDRPPRPETGRPPRDGARGDAGDRPFRPRGPRPEGAGAGDRPARPPRKEFGDRPPRGFADKPKRSFGGADRPKRSGPPAGDRPQRGPRPPARGGAGDRPGRPPRKPRG